MVVYLYNIPKFVEFYNRIVWYADYISIKLFNNNKNTVASTLLSLRSLVLGETSRHDRRTLK
jgi:uncharacterized protein with HEPN domain